MCLRIDPVNVGSMSTSRTYRYSFPKPFVRKKNKVDTGLLLLCLSLLILFYHSEFYSGRKGFFPWLFCTVSPSTGRSAKLHTHEVNERSVPLTLFQQLEVRDKRRVGLGQSSESNVSNV